MKRRDLVKTLEDMNPDVSGTQLSDDEALRFQSRFHQAANREAYSTNPEYKWAIWGLAYHLRDADSYTASTIA